MTEEQRKWLNAHPRYEVVGMGGMLPGGQMPQGSDRHTAMGVLTATGQFLRERITDKHKSDGGFLVGIRKDPPKPEGGQFGGGGR